MTIQNDPTGETRFSSSLPNQHPQQKLLSRFFSLFRTTLAPSIIGNTQITSTSLVGFQDWEAITIAPTEEQNVLTKTSLYTWRSSLQNSIDKNALNHAIDRILDFIENPNITLDLSDLPLTTLPDVFSHHAFRNLKTLNISNNNVNEFPPTFSDLRIRDLHPLTLIINVNSLQSIPQELCNDETKSLISTALNQSPNAPKTLTLILKNNSPTVLSDDTLEPLIDLLISNNELGAATDLANILQDNDKKTIALKKIQTQPSQNSLIATPIQDSSDASSIEDSEDSLSQQIITPLSNLSIKAFEEDSQEPSLQHYQDLHKQLLASPNQFEMDLTRLKALELISKLSPEVFECFSKKLLKEIDQPTINKKLISRLQNEIEQATDRARAKAPTPELPQQEPSASTSLNPIDNSYQISTLAHTVDTLIETKEFQSGMNLVDKILTNNELTSSYKIGALNYIIEVLIEKKHFAEAVFLTTKIPEGEEKAVVLKTTIASLLSKKQTKQAMKVINLIEDPDLKSRQLIRIVDLLIKKQRPEKALEILNTLPDSHLKSLRLLGITDNLIENKQLDKALELLQQVPDDHPDKSKTFNVLINAVIETAPNKTLESKTLVAIADILINEGDLKTAIDIMSFIPGDLSKAWDKQPSI